MAFVVVVGDETMSAYVLFPLRPGQQGGMDGTIRHNINRLRTEKHVGSPKSRYNSDERNVLPATVVLAIVVVAVVVAITALEIFPVVGSDEMGCKQKGTG